jgi:hypothetical protein
LYQKAQAIVAADSWEDKALCPICDRQGDSSLLDHLHTKLHHYAAVEEASAKIAAEWTTRGWDKLVALEAIALGEGERTFFDVANRVIPSASLTAAQAKNLCDRLVALRERAAVRQAELQTQRAAIEATLPPSLVAVVTDIEAARQLRTSWAELEKSEQKLSQEQTWIARTAELKAFLDNADKIFAAAESAASKRRLIAVEPVCREFFKGIVFDPFTPALSKRTGTEELSISLSQFFSLRDVSAQAVLAESARNAFAASVYLAAAKLYGGAPRFIVLDDITSSFDAGNQMHLMEVIRTKFARPQIVDGPQIILLSHDTVLEKLFNRHSNDGGWFHQRLQGTPRTAILLQSGAVNRVRDQTRHLLSVGRVDDAAPFIRQYLEYRLEEVVQKCRIPVLFDVAFSDGALASDLLSAIDNAVMLHSRAGILILDPAQVLALNANVATITGNYLAHWGTGSAHIFSASALTGVMDAIDEYVDCFRFEDPPGQRRFYKSLSQRK